MEIVFDSETTGKCDFKKPAGDPSHPHIVQLGAILYDENKRVVAEMNLIVKPDGWTVPKEAADIHGITTEMAEQYGLALKTVIKLFMVLCQRAKVSVAHNRPYDNLMVETALIRCGLTADLDSWRNMAGHCTMAEMTPVCNIPGRFGRPKWPTLQEAYKHLFGEEFSGAHDAQADTRACARIRHEMVRRREASEITTGQESLKEAA